MEAHRTGLSPSLVLISFFSLLTGVAPLIADRGEVTPVTTGVLAGVGNFLAGAQRAIDRPDWNLHRHQRLASGYMPQVRPGGGFPALASGVVRSMRGIGMVAPLAILADITMQTLSGERVDLVGSLARGSGAALASWGLTVGLVALGVTGTLPLMAALVAGGVAGSYAADWLLARARAGRLAAPPPRGRARDRVSLLGL